MKRALLYAMLTFATVAAAPDVVMDPAVWDAGTVEPGSRHALALRITNNGTTTVEVTLSTTCPRVRARPPRHRLGAGETAVTRLTLRAPRDAGAFQRYFVVLTDPTLGTRRYEVRGTVAPE